MESALAAVTCGFSTRKRCRRSYEVVVSRLAKDGQTRQTSRRHTATKSGRARQASGVTWRRGSLHRGTRMRLTGLNVLDDEMLVEHCLSLCFRGLFVHSPRRSAQHVKGRSKPLLESHICNGLQQSWNRVIQAGSGVNPLPHSQPISSRGRAASCFAPCPARHSSNSSRNCSLSPLLGSSRIPPPLALRVARAIAANPILLRHPARNRRCPSSRPRRPQLEILPRALAPLHERIHESASRCRVGPRQAAPPPETAAPACLGTGASRSACASSVPLHSVRWCARNPPSCKRARPQLAERHSHPSRSVRRPPPSPARSAAQTSPKLVPPRLPAHHRIF